MKKISLKIINEILDYDPLTGVFIWKESTNRHKSGDIAGTKNKNGYLVIWVNGELHYAHRIAWLYSYGYLPENYIDHINRNPSDNRIKNLREVSMVCNIRNCGNFKHNRSGVKGVSWDNKNKKWESFLCVNGENKKLGRHKDFNEAVLHRLAAEQCVGWRGCDSMSPAYQYAITNGLVGHDNKKTNSYNQ